MKSKLYPLWIGTEVRPVPNPYLLTRQEVGRYGTGLYIEPVPSVPTCPTSCPGAKREIKPAVIRTSLPLHIRAVPIRTIRTYSSIGGTPLWQI
jgi:hypothetical protein